MKRKVKVTIEKEFELDIPDNLLTEKHIADFESFIGEMDEDDKVEGLFKYVARAAAYDYHEAEGMGELGGKYMKEHSRSPEYYIVVDELYDDAEMEII